MQLIKLFIGFRGRLGRLAFLFGMLVISIVNAIVWKIVSVDPDLELQSAVALILLLLMSPLAICAKRYHDLGMSGWRAIIPATAVVGLGAVAGIFLAGDAGPYKALAPLGMVVLGLGSEALEAVGFSDSQLASMVLQHVAATGLPLLYALRIFGLIAALNLLKLFLISGTLGDNRYGEEPRLAPLLFSSDAKVKRSTAMALQAMEDAALLHAARATAEQSAAEAEHFGQLQPANGNLQPISQQPVASKVVPLKVAAAKVVAARGPVRPAATFGRRR